MPAYRNRIWDGKIRLFSPETTGELYVGLLPYVEKWLNDYGEEYTLSEELQDGKEIDTQILNGFIRRLNFDPMENLSNLVTTKLMQWTRYWKTSCFPS